MKNCGLILVLICSFGLLVKCIPQRGKNEKEKNKTIQSINKRTGVTTAENKLIEKYEREHQKLHEEEARDGVHLEWPALDNKNVSIYCRKYLQHSIPTKSNDGATGTRIEGEIHYKKTYTSRTNEVIIVQCKVTSLSYYITRALEPNCVYTVKCTEEKEVYIFTIINKYCDFEHTILMNRAKRKRIDTINKMHPKTGQPIAKEKFLLQYELEHQELVKKEGDDGSIQWPHAKGHPNLDFYCHKYMEKCNPRRSRENIKGNWITEKLHYQKLHINNEDIEVIAVKCLQACASERYYYVTRALESNCVYALLRHHRSSSGPFTIAFKCCDFENSFNQYIITQNYDKLDNPKTEVKEELVYSLETLQLFPTN